MCSYPSVLISCLRVEKKGLIRSAVPHTPTQKPRFHNLFLHGDTPRAAAAAAEGGDIKVGHCSRRWRQHSQKQVTENCSSYTLKKKKVFFCQQITDHVSTTTLMFSGTKTANTVRRYTLDRSRVEPRAGGGTPHGHSQTSLVISTVLISCLYSALCPFLFLLFKKIPKL